MWFDIFLEGFSATPGWDAISGLGAPIVPKFLQYIQEIINKQWADPSKFRTNSNLHLFSNLLAVQPKISQNIFKRLY